MRLESKLIHKFSASTFMSLSQHINANPLSLSCLMVLQNGVMISFSKLIGTLHSQLLTGNVTINCKKVRIIEKKFFPWQTQPLSTSKLSSEHPQEQIFVFHIEEQLLNEKKFGWSGTKPMINYHCLILYHSKKCHCCLQCFQVSFSVFEIC